jgi:hypothetical protein
MTEMDRPPTSEQPNPAASPPEGWYDYAGGLRFWDGKDWSDHFAPPRRSLVAVAGATAVGLIVGWLIIWALAQLEPAVFFWPTKTVVDDQGGSFAAARIGAPEFLTLIVLACILLLVAAAARFLTHRLRRR